MGLYRLWPTFYRVAQIAGAFNGLTITKPGPIPNGSDGCFVPVQVVLVWEPVFVLVTNVEDLFGQPPEFRQISIH